MKTNIDARDFKNNFLDQFVLKLIHIFLLALDMNPQHNVLMPKWIRNGGRLVRMEELGVQISSELFMFHNSKVVRPDEDSDIIEQSCETTILPGVAVSQNSPLLSLPPEILELILEMITVNDIYNLIRTCRMLERTFKSRYILHVMVPYPHSVLKHKKPVLKLTSTYDLKQLNKPIAYFSILNLNNLKELKMTGANFLYDDFIELTVLKPEYKQTLVSILFSLPTSSLQKLEILVDKIFCKVVTEPLKRFVNLNELILRGSSFLPYCEQRYHSKTDFLKALLPFTQIKILRLVKFTLNDDLLEVSSNSIEELSISAFKVCTEFKFDLPNLKKLSLGGSYTCHCLFHSHYGGVMKSVHEGCKNIQYFNDLDILNIPDSDKFSSWFENISSEPQKFCDYTRLTYL